MLKMEENAQSFSLRRKFRESILYAWNTCSLIEVFCVILSQGWLRKARHPLCNLQAMKVCQVTYQLSLVSLN